MYNLIITPAFRKILTTTALCLAVVGLSSCTTIIDTGGSLDSIGKEGATHLWVEKKVSWGTTKEEASFSVYKQDSTYYVELPVEFIPARSRDYTCLIYNMGIFLGSDFYYPSIEPDRRYYQKSQSRPETYYAVLTEEQFKIACKSWGKFETPPINDERFPILLSSEVDLQGAQRVHIDTRRVDVRHMIEKIPYRRTTGNQWRRPLVYVLDVADYPLSVAATPIGWISRLIYYSFD